MIPKQALGCKNGLNKLHAKPVTCYYFDNSAIIFFLTLEKITSP